MLNGRQSYVIVITEWGTKARRHVTGDASFLPRRTIRRIARPSLGLSLRTNTSVGRPASHPAPPPVDSAARQLQEMHNARCITRM